MKKPEPWDIVLDDKAIVVRIDTTFDLLYRTHDWVMYRSKWYFDYLMNASILGEPRFVPPTWESYRQAVDESGQQITP